MNDYFLHHKCGYTFDRHGIVSNLTDEEQRRLWQGAHLWQTEIENPEGDSTPKRAAKKADQREFEQFAENVNTSDTPTTHGS